MATNLQKKIIKILARTFYKKLLRKFVFMLISFVSQQNDYVYMSQIVTVFRDTDSNKYVDACRRNDKCVSLYLLSNLLYQCYKI